MADQKPMSLAKCMFLGLLAAFSGVASFKIARPILQTEADEKADLALLEGLANRHPAYVNNYFIRTYDTLRDNTASIDHTLPAMYEAAGTDTKALQTFKAVRDKVMAGGELSTFGKLQLMRELNGAVLKVAADLDVMSQKVGPNTAIDDIRIALIQPLEYLKDFYRAAAICHEEGTGKRVLCITPQRQKAHVS